MRTLFLALTLLPCWGWAQEQSLTPREQAYEQFDAFIGTWELQAFFLDGTKLEQKFEIVRGVQGAVYKVTTFQKDDAGVYQVKSEGVRAWDDKSRGMRFWDFGVDGSISQGSVVFQGANLLYIYEYGTEILTDFYSFEGDGNYEFILGVKEGDAWSTLYANGGLRRVTQ